MKIAFPDQIKEMDRRCALEYGIPEIRLMENAGRSLYSETLKYIEKRGIYTEKLTVSVVCGRGNNGGDGFVAARYFINGGIKTNIFICGEESGIKGASAYENYSILKNMGAELTSISNENIDRISEILSTSDIIIDAILGTGLNSEISGIYEKIITCINRCKNAVKISADIPSGINGENGRIMGTAVNADMTVVMAILKAGNIMYPGKDFCGEIIMADIGVPEKLIQDMKIKIFETEKSLVKDFFPKRKSDTNKGTYGRIGIIGGCEGMTGAGIMASRAALRTGAGLVYNIVPEGVSDIYEYTSLETVTVPVKCENLWLSAGCVKNILEFCQKLDVIVVGPGMGTNEETEDFLYDFLTEIGNIKDAFKKILVLDADALNIVSRNTEILREVNIPTILTPHPGEMARLCGTSVREVQSDRISCARYFSKEFEKTVVLKGAATVTALPDGFVYINPTGNPGMSTGGSGDVLCGIIASMAANGNFELAAPCGAYLHGLAGDIAAEKYGEYGMIAGDIIESLPKAIISIMD